ncbi:CinA family protein [Actinokineospora auranticolor]|uniref:Nicotinamide-nucleotide amidase n=1 Tax=Actinokineospora auranticolor TaxID=155976 RepID=A0A2S6GQN9_9PSEU|nr:CinA family protein [Actinokineospora auranticolor]PPK67493.1 nicotinamide-nucleotide amidase [Actinokineospora auranticolor]
MTQVALLPGVPVAALVAALRDRGETIAAAESLTAGLFTAVLTGVPGSSAVVRGGLVVYATDLKASLAGVDAGLLAARGAVDPEVAAQLAAGARSRCGADIGVGLTGVAGPDPQDGVPPGTAHVALDGPRGPRAVTITTVGDREHVRAAAVLAGLRLVAADLGDDLGTLFV